MCWHAVQVRRLTLASTQQQEDFSARLTRQQLEFSAHCELLQQAVDGALQEKETQLNGAQQQLLQALLEAEDTRAQTVQLGAQVYAYMHAATNAVSVFHPLLIFPFGIFHKMNKTPRSIVALHEGSGGAPAQARAMHPGCGLAWV